MTTAIHMQRGLQLESLGNDTFRNVQAPWTWAGGSVVPGGVLMALAANAAYQTLAPGFALETLSAHFLTGPTNQSPLELAVERIKDGGRFAHRVITVRQTGVAMVHVTCSFVRLAAMDNQPNGMQHTTCRETTATVDAITLDDLAVGRTALGPWMKIQRLAVTHTGSRQTTSCTKQPRPPPSELTYTFAAQIADPIRPEDKTMHALGLVALSDYHVLDCPPTLHNRDFGSTPIGDMSQTRTPDEFKLMTSLNHSIQFRVHDGFRADEIVVIEAKSPWTGERRGEIATQIFDRNGRLLATCKQEGYFVLKSDAKL